MKNNRTKKTKRRSIRLGLAQLLSLIMAAALFSSVPVWAAETETKEGSSEVLQQLAAGSVDEDPFAEEEGSPETKKNYPATFDLRNVNGRSYVTPVRVQNPFGTCWGFAATAAAESSILADERLNKGLDPETFDLSEKHLAWFSASYIKDASSPQYGEGTHFFENEDSAKVHYNTGGYSSYATLCYAAGIGPMLEEDYPYQGVQGEVASRRSATSYDEKGNPKSYAYKDVWYSDDDDWTLPDSERYGNMYRLKESFILPVPAGKDEAGDYCFEQAGVDAIKEQLSEHHRAVAIGFCAESFLPGQDTSGKEFMSENWAHYTWKQKSSNHEVTVVGWDDNYPKENFLEGHQPPENGAFLIKNSWGSELNDFPNNGYRHWGLLEGQDGIPYDRNAKAASDRATGYFWISYYDQSIATAEAFDFDLANNGGYYADEHDSLIMGDIFNTKAEKIKTANVFQTEDTSELSAISVMTTTPDTAVTYEIYLLGGGYKTPTDGVKLTEGSASFRYGGYHRIDLAPSERTVLAKNQFYSVIVTEKAPSGMNYFPFSTGFDKESPFSAKYGFYLETRINPGESYIGAEDEWADLSDREVQKKYIGLPDGMVMDNFLIKAYLEPVEMDGAVFTGYLKPSNWSKGGAGEYSMSVADAPLKLTAEFRGTLSGDPEIKADISWASSDPAVFTVEPDRNNPGDASVVPKGEGLAYLTVDAGRYGRRVIGIRVNLLKLHMDIEDASDPSDPQYVYTGQEIKPKVKVYDDNEKPLEEGKDYTLSFAENIMCGTAFVTATGIGNYGGTETLSFTIIPAKAEVASLTVKGGKKLQVKVKNQKASGITGYEISYRKSGTKKWTAKKLPAAKNVKTLSGLTKGSRYQVRTLGYVKAGDRIFYGDWSKVKTSKKIK